MQQKSTSITLVIRFKIPKASPETGNPCVDISQCMKVW